MAMAPRGYARDPFALHEALHFKGVPIPRFVPWPPPERVPLNEAVALQKLKAIRAYRSQLVEFVLILQIK